MDVTCEGQGLKTDSKRDGSRTPGHIAALARARLIGTQSHLDPAKDASA